jgi:hypothetical protein
MSTPAMLVLRPGDKVLVTLADEPAEETILTVTQDLRRSFPGVEFTILRSLRAGRVRPVEEGRQHAEKPSV